MYDKAKPSRVDPKQLFKQTVFGPVYDTFKEQITHEDANGRKTYDIPPMKLAEIYNKAINRCYELLVLDDVCYEKFGQPLISLPSREARQKFLRKKITKSNRDEIKDAAIGHILDLIHAEEMLSRSHAVCEIVINTITERVENGEPEPDVDEFEAVAQEMFSESQQ